MSWLFRPALNPQTDRLTSELMSTCICESSVMKGESSQTYMLSCTDPGLFWFTDDLDQGASGEKVLARLKILVGP